MKFVLQNDSQGKAVANLRSFLLSAVLELCIREDS